MNTVSKVGSLIDDFFLRVGLMPNILVVNPIGYEELREYNTNFTTYTPSDGSTPVFLGLKVEVDINSAAPFAVKYVTKRAES